MSTAALDSWTDYSWTDDAPAPGLYPGVPERENLERRGSVRYHVSHLIRSFGYRELAQFRREAKEEGTPEIAQALADAVDVMERTFAAARRLADALDRECDQAAVAA